MDPTQAQRILESFVKFLCDRKDAITEEWESAIRRNGRLLTSERLTANELRQHLPDLFDDLANVLKSPAGQGVQNQADKDARRHGHQRFGHNYRLDELVREIAGIRFALITQVIAFEEQTPDFQGMVKRVALQRLHGFCDNMVADAAAQFTQDQQDVLRQDLAKARQEMVRERGERQEAQADLRTAESETEQLREVDSTRLHLLRTVAHELRNSVNAARLTIHGLATETNEETREELITILARGIRHMEALLKDLLTYSLLLGEPKSLDMEPVSVAELSEDMAAMYAPLAEEKGLQFKTECDPALTTVNSHRTKLAQIVSNLLSNAIKYTPSGSVHLSFIGIDAIRWSVIVKDTGPGIAPEEHDEIFTEFHRIRKTANVEGTGLGLALVKRLTLLLGGEVRMESAVGQGSRFEVILPRMSESIHRADEL